MNTQPDEPMQYTEFRLPERVIAALLEPAHPYADVPRARAFGLLDKDGAITPIGECVIAGVDQVTIRHKLHNLLKKPANW